ncbi:MAG TPA: hypothetical protein VN853_14475 [Polyangia bacterium]|nr:hypothetical protein [Polyangia bacterium]
MNALAELFVQVLRLCQAAGMVKLGHVSLDGTKVKADASKHKAMSYERMHKDEQRLREKVADLLKAAANAGAKEDKAHGKHKRGDELPEDLRRAKDRLARIEELKSALEAEARAQHEAKKTADNDDCDPPPGATPLPTHKVPRTKDGTPGRKAQRNFTDPREPDYEGRRRLRAGLQLPSGGRRRAPDRRRPSGDESAARRRAPDARWWRR